MPTFESCAVYQITQVEGWLTGVGMAYQEVFTEGGVTRLDVDHNPDALARLIAGLGKDGWELVLSQSITTPSTSNAQSKNYQVTPSRSLN